MSGVTPVLPQVELLLVSTTTHAVVGAGFPCERPGFKASPLSHDPLCSSRFVSLFTDLRCSMALRLMIQDACARAPSCDVDVAAEWIVYLACTDFKVCNTFTQIGAALADAAPKWLCASGGISGAAAGRTCGVVRRPRGVRLVCASRMFSTEWVMGQHIHMPSHAYAITCICHVCQPDSKSMPCDVTRWS
jgi:hypothetical protein